MYFFEVQTFSYSAHRLPDHAEADGDLQQSAQAAAVEAVEDALGDEDALHHFAHLFHARGVFLSVDELVCSLGTSFACVRVAEDASHNQGGEVSQLGAADAASSAESERPEEGGEDEAADPGRVERVHDRVEEVHYGPAGQVLVGNSNWIASARVEAFHSVVGRNAIVLADAVVVGSHRGEAPIEAHEGSSDHDRTARARGEEEAN